MPERPDLQAAVERLRLMDVSDLFLRRNDVDIVLARLEELEDAEDERDESVRVHMRNTIRLTVDLVEVEADARAMREAIAQVWRDVRLGEARRRLGEAALRGWSPSWVRA